MGDLGVHCQDCGAHFSLDPAGDIAGAACSECGGTRFFMDQPSPVHSEGTLRDMVDSDSQKDQGGNPLGEGVIMGRDGEKPAFKRDNFMHGKVAGPGRVDYLLDPEHQPTVQLQYGGPGYQYQDQGDFEADNPTGKLQGFFHKGLPDSQLHMIWEDQKTPGYNTHIPIGNLRGIKLIDGQLPPEIQHLQSHEPGQLPRGAKVAYPTETPMMYEHSDIPEGMSAMDWRRQTVKKKCDNCGFPFLAQPEQRYCAKCLWEHPELAQPGAATPSISTLAVTQRVEPMSRSLNTDPYAPLWHESYLPKTAGPLMALLPEGLAAGAEALGIGSAGALASKVGPTLMKGVLGHEAGQAVGDLGGNQLMGDLTGAGDQQSGDQNQAGPGMDYPDEAPSLQQLSHADIPMLLLGAMDTPHSVKSVGEQHDDPQDVDQKEFNDGESDPNPDNPNLDDSGAVGEDGVDPHTGFSVKSPALERMGMIFPLLMHYFNSPESGENDPIIRGLHDSLEQENPGYLSKEHPQGKELVQILIQHHKQPKGVHAGVNAMPGGLPATPTPMGLGGNPGGGTCPSCGGTLAGDGSCPQCGAKGHPQGGMQGPGLTGGPSLPPGHAHTAAPLADPWAQAVQNFRAGGPHPAMQLPDHPNAQAYYDSLSPDQQNQFAAQMVTHPQLGQPAFDAGTSVHQFYNGGRTATHTGPVTPEQIAAVQQLLITKHQVHLVPDVPLHPENYAKEMDEIQGDANTAPLVDPSQLTPPPPPPPGAPGSMPMPDPSQAGAGGQPMQPMAHIAADAVAPRCPECHSGSTGLRNGGSQADITAECSACGHVWTPPGIDMNKYKASLIKEAPGNQHMKGVSPKRNRQYEHIKEQLMNSGKSEEEAAEEAARTVNKQRKQKGETKSKVVLTELVNPLLDPAADQHQRHERGQDSSLTFQDDQGQPLAEGQIYELSAPTYAIPDEVRVVSVKPNEVELQPVGLDTNFDNSPAIKLTPQDIQQRQYTFSPSPEVGQDDQAPVGGETPGQVHIPESGQTTDEHSNSFPNTVSHATGAILTAVAASDEDQVEMDENICHKCGSEDTNHHMSSATTTMHECYRCGAVWETNDDFEGRKAGVDLDWILNDSGPGNDDFFAEMERAQKMYGGGSRSLAAAAARDPRYEQVREVLEQNRQARVAGRHFTPGEQRDLINEDGTARNADRLDLAGTHYEARYDPTGKANGANVPPEHMVLGI